MIVCTKKSQTKHDRASGITVDPDNECRSFLTPEEREKVKPFTRGEKEQCCSSQIIAKKEAGRDHAGQCGTPTSLYPEPVTLTLADPIVAVGTPFRVTDSELCASAASVANPTEAGFARKPE
jgi:hypothetical protein